MLLAKHGRQEPTMHWRKIGLQPKVNWVVKIAIFTKVELLDWRVVHKMWSYFSNQGTKDEKDFRFGDQKKKKKMLMWCWGEVRVQRPLMLTDILQIQFDWSLHGSRSHISCSKLTIVCLVGCIFVIYLMSLVRRILNTLTYAAYFEVHLSEY